MSHSSTMLFSLTSSPRNGALLSMNWNFWNCEPPNKLFLLYSCSGPVFWSWQWKSTLEYYYLKLMKSVYLPWLYGEMYAHYNNHFCWSKGSHRGIKPRKAELREAQRHGGTGGKIGYIWVEHPLKSEILLDFSVASQWILFLLAWASLGWVYLIVNCIKVNCIKIALLLIALK